MGDNEKSITYCNQVDNTKDYSDYVFLTIDYGDGGIASIALTKPSDCFGPGKHEHIDVVAIKKRNFNSGALGQLQNGVNNQSAENNYAEQETKVADYLKRTQAMTTRADFIDTYQVIPKNNTLASVNVIWQITKLNETNFDLQKSKLVYKYTNGTTKEEIVDRPKPGYQAVSSVSVSDESGWWADNFLYVIFPGAALLLIVIFLLMRKFKKG